MLTNRCWLHCRKQATLILSYSESGDHICICIHVHFPKQNLLSPYNAVRMYVFRADRLALDNQLVHWGPPLHSQLSSVACSAQVSPHSVWHAHWWPPVLLVFGQSRWWDLMGVASDVSGHSLTVNSGPPALTAFPPLFCSVPRATGAAVFYRCSHLSQQWKP